MGAPLDIAALFDRVGPAVYRRALYLLGHPADAEEITQEVFLRALDHQDTFEARASASTWIIKITTNLCLNHIRDRRRRQELWREHLGSLPPAMPGAPSPENLLILRRLLAEADERSAEAAIYVLVDGMSHQEAAECLGVSRRTVGNLVERFTRWARERVDGGSGSGGN